MDSSGREPVSLGQHDDAVSGRSAFPTSARSTFRSCSPPSVRASPRQRFLAHHARLPPRVSGSALGFAAIGHGYGSLLVLFRCRARSHSSCSPCSALELEAMPSLSCAGVVICFLRGAAWFRSSGLRRLLLRLVPGVISVRRRGFGVLGYGDYGYGSLLVLYLPVVCVRARHRR